MRYFVTPGWLSFLEVDEFVRRFDNVVLTNNDQVDNQTRQYISSVLNTSEIIISEYLDNPFAPKNLLKQFFVPASVTHPPELTPDFSFSKYYYFTDASYSEGEVWELSSTSEFLNINLTAKTPAGITFQRGVVANRDYNILDISDWEDGAEYYIEFRFAVASAVTGSQPTVKTIINYFDSAGLSTGFEEILKQMPYAYPHDSYNDQYKIQALAIPADTVKASVDIFILDPVVLNPVSEIFDINVRVYDSVNQIPVNVEDAMYLMADFLWNNEQAFQALQKGASSAKFREVEIPTYIRQMISEQLNPENINQYGGIYKTDEISEV